MARKPIEVENYYISDLFMSVDYLNELKGWVQDVIYGSSCSGHSKPSSPHAIFKALGTLQIISFETVNHFVNNKSEVVNGVTYSERHVYTFMQRLISALRGIQFHYERFTGHSLESTYHRSVPIQGDFIYADGIPSSEIFHKKVVINSQNNG